jgi:hypothetical protein
MNTSTRVMTHPSGVTRKDRLTVITNTVAATKWSGIRAKTAIGETPGHWVGVALRWCAQADDDHDDRDDRKAPDGVACQRRAMTANTAPPTSVHATVKIAIAAGVRGANLESMPRPARRAVPRATLASPEIAAAMRVARPIRPRDSVAGATSAVILGEVLG